MVTPSQGLFETGVLAGIARACATFLNAPVNTQESAIDADECGAYGRDGGVLKGADTMPLFRLAAACLLLLLGLADLATPTRARTLIETVNPDGSPVDRTPKTVEYNWSDHTPAGVMRGTWDIADDDPRLQPAPEGHPEQIVLLYYGTDAVRVGWATGVTRFWFLCVLVWVGDWL